MDHEKVRAMKLRKKMLVCNEEDKSQSSTFIDLGFQR
ncbi:hypothetical protein COLO4_03687 [Corchorus olitorius]|uniref:Uncharacterized protein n=1 Tax=Corchorus olitorius TaxID=93759 RepID=A0A1R3KXF9_9ROSI|nr:hypothetical protein COLO4_03687 [Corchorus olitorius]